MNASEARSEAAKVEFLSRASSYPGGQQSVEVIETHFAWVFLSREFAYKLKKPIRTHGFDLRSIAARRANCELELSLNRRLAETVYIGVTPLVATAGGWALDGPGEPDDWLVKMRRLPRERALDRAAARGTVTDSDLERVADKLAAFYARTVRAPWNGADYRRRLADAIARNAADLARADIGIPARRIHALAAAQLLSLSANASLLDARVAEGRVVDAHGDLRPEHVFLEVEPQIIDCLEFSAELRLLDTAEEIAFFVLECDRLGAGFVGARIRELYRQRCADDVPPPLLAFYRCRRAQVRALLAAWHLHDAYGDGERDAWRDRARWYVGTAESALVTPAAAQGGAASGTGSL